MALRPNMKPGTKARDFAVPEYLMTSQPVSLPHWHMHERAFRRPALPESTPSGPCLQRKRTCGSGVGKGVIPIGP
jgi:hypothetical protein